jgi:hypothetical protein
VDATQEIFAMTEESTDQRLVKLERWVIEHDARINQKWENRDRQDSRDAKRFGIIESKMVETQVRVGRLEARIAAYVGIIAPLAGALAGVIGSAIMKAFSS